MAHDSDELNRHVSVSKDLDPNSDGNPIFTKQEAAQHQAILDALEDLDINLDSIDIDMDDVEALLATIDAVLDAFKVEAHADSLDVQAAVDELKAQQDADLTELQANIGDVTDIEATGDGSVIAILKRLRTRLDQLITDFNAEDFASETTLAAFKAENATNLNDIEADIEAFKAAFDARDLATETTQSAFKSEAHADSLDEQAAIDELKAVEQAEHDETQGLIGEVSATPTANTLQDRLKNIYEAVDGLELSIDNIDIDMEVIGEVDDLEATGDGTLIAITKRLRTLSQNIKDFLDAEDFAQEATQSAFKAEAHADSLDEQAAVDELKAQNLTQHGLIIGELQDVEADIEALISTYDTHTGEVSLTPTANTVLGRLKDIHDKLTELDAAFDAEDFASETTLDAFKTQNSADLQSIEDNQTDGSQRTGVLGEDGATIASHDNPLPVSRSGLDPLDSANSTQTPLNQGTLTVFTADSGTDTLTSVAHGLSDGDRVVLTTDGTLPDELEADLVYFVINKTDDTFQLAADEDAVSVVDFLDNGTGTHEFAVPDTFTGPWTRLNTHTDLFMFAFANVPLGEFEVQWSNDGITKRSGLLNESDLKSAENADTPGFYIYLDTLTTDIDNYYRVIASGSTQTSFLTEIDTWVYPGGFHGTYLGLNDALSNLSTALLARAVISAERDDGTFGNVGATRRGNLKNAIAEFADSAQHSSAAVPATPFKTVPTEVPQDFYRVRFDRNNLDEVINQTESSGDYDIGRIGVLGQFKTNGSGGALAIGRTNDHLEYDPAHGYFMDFTQVVATDNAEADSYYYTGGLSATNGFAVGRAPDALNPTREFGLLHRRGGVDEFIPQSKWNIDKCDGSEGSGFFTRNATTGEKEVIELTPQNGRVWSIVSGYLGFSSTAFFVKPPGAIHYVLVHVLPHDDPDTSLTDPDLPGACEVYEGAASGNPMDIRSGSWRGGSYRAREESHYTSAGSRTGSLAANTEFVGQGTEVKGFDQVDVVILADEASADSGIRFQGQNRDDEWFDITPKFKHGGLAGTSRLNDAGTKGVRAFQIAVGGVDRFRVKYLQGPVTGDVDVFTIAVPRITLTSIHRLGDSTTADRSVLVNKSAVIAAVADADLNLDSENGDFLPVGQTSDGGLIVANPWRSVFEQDDIATGTLPSGATPSFDKVGPIVAANVIDSGWMNESRFKIQFAQLQFDIPGVTVFLMNAADDQGNHSRTKDFTVPSAISKDDGFGNVESIVVSAPFFQKWFRIVVYNDSGTDCDEYSIRSMGSDTPLGGVMQSLGQAITDEFPALINQSVVKAASEVTGIYESIKSDNQGRLLVNAGSDFSRLLQRNVENNEKLKLDVEPTNTTHYVGTAITGTAESATEWDILGIKLSATKNPTDIEFVQGIAWDDRTNATHWSFTP